jgi:PAS domain-containing protein
MARWDRSASAVGEARIIAVLGGLYTATATIHGILLWSDGQPLSDVVPIHLLIGLPGVVLLYGGYQLPDTDLRSDVYPRIVVRCLAGIAIMLAVVGLLAVGSSGGLNHPFFTPVAGTALGSVAGFGIGLNEARALSRAREAEQHRDELLRERNLREGIVETSPIGIAVIDADGRISVVNEHVAEMVGYLEDELRGLEYHASMLEPTTADGTPTEDFIFEQVMETGDRSTTWSGN